MTSYSAPRDTIQISLGSTANAITAHSLNLQGLACTKGDAEEEAYCDAGTTHSVERNHLIPRVLLIDEPTRFFVSPHVSQQIQHYQDQTVQSQSHQILASGPLSFGIQPLDSALTLKHEESNAWDSFFNSSSVLANSSHSRYYQEPPERGFKVDSSNPRHVVWDDDEEEEEDPAEKQARLYRQKMNWHRSTEAPIQQQLQTMAETLPKPGNWMEYLMPPYSERSKVALPFSRQSQMVAHWDSYTNHSGGDWKEDVLFENVRRLLEDCDTCQGVTITTQGHGIYAGLTTSLLQEFQEECKSAGRLVQYVINPTEDNKEPGDEKEKEKSDGESPWQPAHIDRLRKHMVEGMAWNDFTQNAHAVLPLHIDTSTHWFDATAHTAMALEASTLPYRLSGRPARLGEDRYKIGLQNAPFFGHDGGDDRWGSTAKRLSFFEFLACLQPSPRYSVLELDVLDTDVANEFSNSQLWQKLQQGTSIERDQRMRQGSRDRHMAAPGEWLKDKSHKGLLSSRSFAPVEEKVDRSMHYHFALSASVRPILEDTLSNYLTAMVQGMGIQYRPERSMCTVMDQTIGDLTLAGGYGAGAYWNSIIKPDTPTLAVIGNTSRPYVHLHQMVKDMKKVMGPRYRGYYQRDVMNGVLPELEDCDEALANNWDLVDVYMPPEGTGLVEDDGIDIDF